MIIVSIELRHFLNAVAVLKEGGVMSRSFVMKHRIQTAGKCEDFHSRRHLIKTRHFHSSPFHKLPRRTESRKIAGWIHLKRDQIVIRNTLLS